MQVLVIAAHPDDEILGCGGTMVKHIRQGDSVELAILGEGITSRYDHPDQADESLLVELEQTTKNIAQNLGIEQVYQLGLPDNRFDSLDLLDLVKEIEEIIEKAAPEVIYTHQADDLNIDHELTHRAVVTATRPVGSGQIREIHGFEVPSSTEWRFSQGQDFSPNRFVDISNSLEEKVQAMEQYETEVADFPHPRSPEGLRALARNRGTTAGCSAAEAFEVIRIIDEEF